MKKHHNTSFISLIAKTGVAVLFMLIAIQASAQTKGTVTVIKDARIDSVIAKRIALSKLPGSNTTNGYRVQFFSGSNRTDAYNAQAKFNDLYPDIKTYIIYSEPNFKVKAGDFNNRLDATRLMEQLRKQFTSLFIITEKINLPKTDSDDQR